MHSNNEILYESYVVLIILLD